MKIGAVLNKLANTTGLHPQGAANVLAGTTGLHLGGALNVAAGNTQFSGYKSLNGVLNQLAGTSGLGTDEAASNITVNGLFIDEFNLPTFNPRWVTVSGTPLPAISGGACSITSSAGYPFIATTQYVCTNRMISAKIGCLPAAGGGNETVFTMRIDSPNKAQILCNGTNILFRVRKAGTWSNTTIAYDATAMAWWRIKELSGSLYYYTSPDGVTWTLRATEAAHGLSFASASVNFEAGFWSAETPAVATLDNVSLLPSA